MKIIPFGRDPGKEIKQYGSLRVMFSGIAHLEGETFVSCMVFDKDGKVGYHQATLPQLFMVVQGDGLVRSKSEERVPARAGLVAFWEKGEWHESGSGTGMTALVIEADSIRPVGNSVV